MQNAKCKTINTFRKQFNFAFCILHFALFISLCTTNAEAVTVAEMTRQVMDRFNVGVSDDISVLRLYKNHGLIDDSYKPLLASAIRAGLLVPSDMILEPESDDLTSVKNGLINFGLRNENLRLVAGRYEAFRVGGAVINPDTTLHIDEVAEGEIFTALTDRQNNALAVWKPSGVILPTLYRAKMYIKHENMMVVYNIERLSFNMWLPVSLGEFVEVDLTGTSKGAASDDVINTEFLDETVYYVGEGF